MLYKRNTQSYKWTYRLSAYNYRVATTSKLYQTVEIHNHANNQKDK